MTRYPNKDRSLSISISAASIAIVSPCVPLQRKFQIKKNIAFASSHQRRDGPEYVVKPPVSERYYDKRYRAIRLHLFKRKAKSDLPPFVPHSTGFSSPNSLKDLTPTILLIYIIFSIICIFSRLITRCNMAANQYSSSDIKDENHEIVEPDNPQ